MTIKELYRNRIAIILLLLIPTLFYALIVLTTSDRIIAFKLASISEETFVQVSEESESLIFIGLAVVGLLTSFVALNLMQKNFDVNRRLIICGFHSSEIILSKLIVLVGVIFLIGLYAALMLLLFFSPEYLLGVLLGFVLGGYVYGCYGLLIGSIFKHELEGILFIVLLANIDAGWLQNPIYYAEAQSKIIIRYLPAFHPSQISIISGFTDYSFAVSFILSITYGAVFLIAALIIFGKRTRIKK
ncbi:MAG: hypothetical protein KKD86_14425 [Bacteroidetes bacterium]|nr:hypothetical protein [Bacteroidota bacterium]